MSYEQAPIWGFILNQAIWFVVLLLNKLRTRSITKRLQSERETHRQIVAELISRYER